MRLAFWIGGHDNTAFNLNRDDRPHWTYSGFHEFRIKLAALAGINLKTMAGYTKGREKWLSWDSYRSDPISILLMHSDSDGDISPEDCGKLWPRLNQLLEGSGDTLDEYDVQHGFKLVRLMAQCEELGRPLVFC